MGTRSGDLDPGLVWYLARSEKMSAKQFNEMINFQSGLLGMSETSSDMSELLDNEVKDVRAAEAVEVFCYQVKKWIGASAEGPPHQGRPRRKTRRTGADHRRPRAVQHGASRRHALLQHAVAFE